MFSASFSQGGSLLKKIVDILKDNVKEVVFLCEKEGISIQSMDSSHVALVDIFINRNAAETYSCEDRVEIGINIDNLATIFKCNTSNDACLLTFDEKKPDILVIKFQGKNRNGKFQLKLINIEFEKLSIPPIDRESSQMVSLTELAKIFKDLSNFADQVNITRKDNLLLFTGNGEIGDAEFTIEMDSSHDTRTSALFSLRYLSWFTKSLSLFDFATMSFDATNPLILELDLEDSLNVKFFLAPRFDEN